MGNTKSASQEVTDTGVVNTNVIVQEPEVKLTQDVKALLWIIAAAVIVQLLIKVYNVHRRGMKKKFSRRLATQP